jgi:hypothetical protein
VAVRTWLLVGATAAAAGLAFLAPAFPQPLSYHDFADGRAFLGLPHFLNVASNVPFLLAGAYGLTVVLGSAGRQRADGDERRSYIVFFVGSMLTALGSAYYHAAPDNARLLWDRLPMTLGFAGLTAAVFAERIDRVIGRRALVPLLLLGVSSVLYWHYTELEGRGNVLPYAIYQGWTIAVVAFAVLAYPSRRYSHGAALWWVVALYALAKAAEALDPVIYRLGHIVSGHTLKHLFAAAAVLAVAEMLRRRTPSSAGHRLPAATAPAGLREGAS